MELTGLNTDRIRKHTSPEINRRIDRETEEMLEALDTSLDVHALRRRLAQIDREWDIDRAVEALFALVGGATARLGRRSRFWWAVFGVNLGFLLYHALRGWCPPVSLLRRLGFRTTREIEAERRALLARLAALEA